MNFLFALNYIIKTERKICEVKLEKNKDSKIIIRNNLYSNKIIYIGLAAP